MRLSSIEATEVTRELIDVMAEQPDKVCPHLHISMQSGSDGVLRRMRRRWGSRRFIDRCRLFQERLDRPAITTDVIVGFPGETDAEFAETVAACREVGFSKIHIFPFSPRRGTPAAAMPGQLPKHVKQRAARRAGGRRGGAAGRVFRIAPRHAIAGPGRSRPLPQRVECDAAAPSIVGTSCRYAPVESPAGAARVGEFVDVVAGDARTTAAFLRPRATSHGSTQRPPGGTSASASAAVGASAIARTIGSVLLGRTAATRRRASRAAGRRAGRRSRR